MLLPLLLIVVAILAAAIMAYGTDPALILHAHGLDIIVLTRRLQWPLASFSILCCIALLILVIAAKRRVWWLIGLAPIVALFFHRFATAPVNYFSIADEPPLVSADQATFLHDDDWVVGIKLDDDAFAYPFQQIYSTPIVLQSDREKRLLLLWSPFANDARAFLVDREIKARELDIVSMPANALLVYNSRNGQFINGLTGQTTPSRSTAAETPSGFTTEIPAQKTTWKLWHTANPDTKVMSPPANLSANLPSAPVLPLYPMPPMKLDPPANTHITVVPTTQPIAFRADQITSTPQNVMAGKTPLLIFRDPAHELHIFDRRIDEDLMPRFELNHNARRKDVAFIDADTKSGWSWAGIAIDGNKDFKGKKLRPIPLQPDLYWGVMKYWYPDLELIKQN